MTCNPSRQTKSQEAWTETRPAKDAWACGFNGAGKRPWFVFQDVRWFSGNLGRYRRDQAEDSRGNVRRFTSRAAAQKLADALNATNGASRDL